MLSLTDWYWTLGGFRPPRHGREAAWHDAEPADSRSEGATVQRLMELQDELHQLERLPGTLARLLPDGAGEPLVGLMPAWQERVVSIDAEIESLREELCLEAPEREAGHPRAAEATGQRILQQRRLRERAPESRTSRLADPWTEADAGRVGVGVDDAPLRF